MYIANIVTTSRMNVSSFFNVTNEFSTINRNIPTLIVGWNTVKQLYPNQNILDFKINDTTFWTFSKREKRYQYEKDLDFFMKKVINDLNDKINYRFFNYALSALDKRDSFVTYVKNGGNSIYYNSRFLYVYNIKDNITIGVSLTDLAYIGINTKEFISNLNTKDNIMCDNLKCIDTDSFSLIKDNVKVIAYLNYLKNIDIYNEKNI